MTFPHNQLGWVLGFFLQLQLDMNGFMIRVDAGHLPISPSRYYIPDVMVIPAEVSRPLHDDFVTLEAYASPLPLVVEVWSRSTAQTDLDQTLPFYRERGDQEIWFLHPIERTLTAWRRQPDGSYTEQLHRAGVVHPTALPGVAIDLDQLFDRMTPRR